MTEADEPITAGAVLVAIQEIGSPVVTTDELADAFAQDAEPLARRLETLVEDGELGSRRIDPSTRVWFPAAWDEAMDQEHVLCFPDERMIVVDRPDQYTRALLSQFADLEASTGTGGYRYRIRPVDIWHAPFRDIEALHRAVRGVIADPAERLLDWIDEQWHRARQFRLETHPDGYTVLVAGTPELMGNVARQVLTDEQLHGPISETESWVVEGSEASIKRALYEEGFPVQDVRDLDAGDPLEFSTELALRDYQRTWVETFMEAGRGVIVGPPGSGKTVAAIEIMRRVGGETLIFVPSRDLAAQWRDVILSTTSLGQDEVGEYHGGTKDLRPVTIATYHIASMSRHRHLFDDRQWGLIVFDEAQHVPATVYRHATDLQSQFALGITATPVREDEKAAEIYTLLGSPIGTDWAALIEAGFVLEPSLEIRYLPWASPDDREAYDLATGIEQRQIAGMNPAKLNDIRHLLNEHRDETVLIFVDWLEQGRTYAEELGIPFISGETRHAEREHHLTAVRAGEQEQLIVSRIGDEGLDLPAASVAILASGLGGSRRQGTQRAGRTMRPTASAAVYTLATRGTVEEEFAMRQLQHLRGKGMQIRETNVDLSDTEDDSRA